MIILNILEVKDILSNTKLVIDKNACKKKPESLRLEFLKTILANTFALSDAEDITSGPSNRGGITDLPFLKTLFTILQKSQQWSFREVTVSFILVTLATLTASRTLLQWLLGYLDLGLDLALDTRHKSFLSITKKTNIKLSNLVKKLFPSKKC